MKTLITLLLFPLLAFSQIKNNWELLENNKIVAKGNIAKLLKCSIKNTKNNSLQLKPKNIVGFKTNNYTFIVMDTNRVEIFRKEVTNSDVSLKLENSFFIDEQKTKRTIIVYVSGIPKDPEKAKLVRVAPLPLVQISLKD